MAGETLGGDYIGEVLTNDADVTALTTAIYNALRVPADVTALTTINYYMTGPFNPARDYFEVTWSIDCRAATQIESFDLASRVRIALHRLFLTHGEHDYFGTITGILQTIPPVDKTDVFNTPVQIKIRRR